MATPIRKQKPQEEQSMPSGGHYSHSIDNGAAVARRNVSRKIDIATVDLCQLSPRRINCPRAG